MILVDTSVWVEHFRGTEAAEALWLADALAADEELCICGLVLTEILQGISSQRQHRVTSSFLESLVYLPAERETHVLAAELYRTARKKGRTIRNTVDCIIAACAIAHDVPLLQRDRDFVTIADLSALQLVRV